MHSTPTTPISSAASHQSGNTLRCYLHPVKEAAGVHIGAFTIFGIAFTARCNLAGVYWELSKMNRKFIISHSVTGTILCYPRPLLRRDSSKRQDFPAKLATP